MSTTSEDRAAGMRPRRPAAILLRLAIVVCGVMLWFWTQSLLGSRVSPSASGVEDVLHVWTTRVNLYLHASPRAADALLVVSSALVDAFGLFLIGSWLFRRSVRPFFGLAILLVIRQLVQALTK